jgi:hypothetical protein
MQRPEQLFEMVGAGVEVVRIGAGIDRMGNIAGEGGDQFGVRQPHRTCGLWRSPARHQLAKEIPTAWAMGHSVARVRAGGEFTACHRPVALHASRLICCQYIKYFDDQNRSASWAPTKTHPRSPISNACIGELFAHGGPLAQASE